MEKGCNQRRDFCTAGVCLGGRVCYTSFKGEMERKASSGNDDDDDNDGGV